MSRSQKISAIYSLLIITLAGFVVVSAPAGYQISIFHHFSDVVIGLGFILLLGAYFAVVRFRVSDLYAAVPVLTIALIVLLLPEALHYQFNFGDVTTHLSHARLIVDRGGFESVPTGPASYPLLHLLWASTAIATGESVNAVMIPTLLLAFTLYAVLCGLIARNYGRIGLFAVVLAPFSLFKLVVPAVYSYALILPFLVYLLSRPGLTRHQRVPVVVLALVAIWVGHPIPALVFNGLLVAYIVIKWALKRLPEATGFLTSLRNGQQAEVAVNRRIVGISGVVGLIWFMYLTPWLHLSIFYSFKLLSSLFGLQGSTTTDGGGAASDQVASTTDGGGAASDQVASTTDGGGAAFDQVASTIFGLLDLSVAEFGWIAIKLYGDIWLLLIVSFVWLVLTLQHHRTRVMRHFPLFLLFFVFVPPLLSGFQFVTGFNPVVSYDRMLRAAIFIGPALAGLALADGYEWLQANRLHRGKTVAAIALAMLLVSGTAIGVLGLYGTPGLYSRNSHVAESESVGWNWYFAHKEPRIVTVTPGTSPERYAERFLSLDRFKKEGKAVHLKEVEVCRTPRHFAGETHLGSLFGGMYYIEPIRDRLWNVYMYGKFQRFNESDFRSLQADPSVNQVYQSGGFNVATIGPDPARTTYPDSCVQSW